MTKKDLIKQYVKPEITPGTFKNSSEDVKEHFKWKLKRIYG